MPGGEVTTEAPTRMEIRTDRLVAHLKEQLEAAAAMGGNVQLIIDVKVSNGSIVGEACFDLKHRIDLQNG